MFQVTLEQIGRNGKSRKTQTFLLDQEDTPQYDETMKKLADIFFNLDVDFDADDGEGDIAVDDILISVAEEENFEKKLSGRKYKYIVRGQMI